MSSLKLLESDFMKVYRYCDIAIYRNYPFRYMNCNLIIAIHFVHYLQT
jgi:hypothetical protein